MSAKITERSGVNKWLIFSRLQPQHYSAHSPLSASALLLCTCHMCGLSLSCLPREEQQGEEASQILTVREDFLAYNPVLSVPDLKKTEILWCRVHFSTCVWWCGMKNTHSDSRNYKLADFSWLKVCFRGKKFYLILSVHCLTTLTECN